MSISRLLLVAPAVAAVIGVTLSVGCKVAVVDDDVGGTAGATVGSGVFIPQCGGVQPVAVHAKLSRNDEVLRIDARDGDGAAAIAPIVAVGVYAATPTGFTVDACGVNPCASPEFYSATLDRAGEALEVPDGAFVELSYTSADDGSFAVVVTNVADITGVPNPIDEEAHVWFQLMEGWEADAPFEASFTLSVACDDASSGVRGHGLVVSVADAPEQSITVPIGAFETWTLGTTEFAGTYRVRNISSFAQGEFPMSALFVAWKGPAS